MYIIYIKVPKLAVQFFFTSNDTLAESHFKWLWLVFLNLISTTLHFIPSKHKPFTLN